MKRFLPVFLVIVVALVGYAAWPLYSLNKIRTAIENRDADALDRMVDYPELRRSLTEQVVGAYLKASGKAQRLGALGTQVATGLGATVADPMVEKLLNSKALIELFTSGRVRAAEAGGGDLPLGGVNFEGAFSSGWELFKNSEYGARVYDVSVPPGAPADKRFRLRLRLSDWDWKLSGVQMPPDVTLRLAQELQKSAAAR